MHIPSGKVIQEAKERQRWDYAGASARKPAETEKIREIKNTTWSSQPVI